VEGKVLAQDGSVAPKERINIKFKPATGNASEEQELPLKLLMVGDFMGRQDDRTIEERQLVNIDKDNFDDVMKSSSLSADVVVDNKLDDSADAGSLGIHLNFQTLRSFEPEAIARQVPELRKMLELREALASLKGPLSNMPGFRKSIQGLLDDETARQKLVAELIASPNKD
jgi:type VI secretion system protein ImpB